MLTLYPVNALSRLSPQNSFLSRFLYNQARYETEWNEGVHTHSSPYRQDEKGWKLERTEWWSLRPSNPGWEGHGNGV